MGKSFFDYLKPEDHEQIAVIQFLKLQHPEMKFHHSPNEGKRSKFEIFLINLLGVKAGFPDLIIFYEGYNMALELKVGKNEPTDLQMDWLYLLHDNDWFSCWANSLEMAMQLINDFKIWVDGQRRERVQAPKIRERKERKSKVIKRAIPNYRKNRSI